MFSALFFSYNTFFVHTSMYSASTDCLIHCLQEFMLRLNIVVFIIRTSYDRCNIPKDSQEFLKILRIKMMTVTQSFTVQNNSNCSLCEL